MATKHECFACSRARKRAQESPIDRHNPGIRRDHQKLVEGVREFNDGAISTADRQTTVLQIRDLVTPYLAPIADFLPRLSERERQVVHVRDDEGLATALVGRLGLGII
jgi:hypothetical protein